MKTTLKALKGRQIQRLLIESVDLSLYIAHAEIDEQRLLIAAPDGSVFKTRNLLDMKSALASLKADALVLIQRSSYDEMVGQSFPPGDNQLEIILGEGYERLPPWQH